MAPSTCLVAARVGVSRAALAEPDKDGGDAGVSRHEMPAWVRRPTVTATPLPLLLHAASSLLTKILERWACPGPPAWIDPMLEEFVGSLMASPPAGACSTASVGASQEVDTSLVDTRSPVKIAQWMIDSPPSLYV
jgi:hypothetical protein